MYRSNSVKPWGASGKKFYLKTIMDRTVGFEEFVSHMASHNSIYSRGTIHGVLTDMLDCLQELLLDGKSVRFGELGLFSLGVNSGLVETREEVGPALVKNVRLRLSNTKSWSNRELTKKCRFEELRDYESGKKKTETEEGSSRGEGGDEGGSSRGEGETEQP